jgi:pyruvate-formate lyase-activating enzyme
MPHSHDPRFKDFLNEYGVDSVESLGQFPKFIQIETISLCNARCTMCTINSWVRARNYMPDELFARLVKEIAAHSNWVEQVTLQLGGEPLLDRKLEQRARELKEAGVRSIAFTSNASLLTEERARSILACGVDIIDFSVDGASAETFDSIRLGLSYETVRDNILRFIALRDGAGSDIQIRVRMVVQPGNAGELDEFVAFWQPKLGRHDSVLGRFLNRWTTWHEDLAVIDGSHLRAKPALPTFDHLPCLSPFATLVVLVDGRVPLCCLDYNAETPMGTLETSSISEVWRGAAFEAVRSRHLKSGRKSMEVCHGCQIFVAKSGFDFDGGSEPATTSTGDVQ